MITNPWERRIESSNRVFLLREKFDSFENYAEPILKIAFKFSNDHAAHISAEVITLRIKLLKQSIEDFINLRVGAMENKTSQDPNELISEALEIVREFNRSFNNNDRDKYYKLIL